MLEKQKHHINYINKILLLFDKLSLSIHTQCQYLKNHQIYNPQQKIKNNMCRRVLNKVLLWLKDLMTQIFSLLKVVSIDTKK